MKIVVCLGTGGVGKTSVAASIALASAREGAKCLVLTTDPALRLRTALGLKEGLLEQRVPVDDAEGELWAALLDVNATLDEAVRLYAKPRDQPRILQHPIYRTIAHSLSGMQELMAVERIDQLIRSGFDNLVIDTAPARHALDIFDKPMLFADFSESGKVRFVSRTYKIAEALGLTTIGRGAAEVYGRVESIMGTSMVKEILDFYSLFHPIAEGYSDRARKTVALLRDPAVTEFRVVTVPDKALRDAQYFVSELKKRDFATGMICVNRTWSHAVPASVPDGFAAELLDWYSSVSASHRRSIEKLRETFGPDVKQIRVLSELERDVEGLDSLRRLARQLQPATETAANPEPAR
ncbi:MAG: ArsA-related P-loop ATPase [Bryobacteraceae bacterium]|jgi:anion-transporting  ArsA/GET3 family ATPase